MKKINDQKIHADKKNLGSAADAEEWKNKYLRALADYQNLEKRVVQEYEERAKHASGQIITDMLTVLDTLEKAQNHLRDDGLTLGVAELKKVLVKHGLRKIDVLQKKFNPLEMECIDVVKSEKENEVLEEIRAGYMLADKVIRVAQVKVGKKQMDLSDEEVAKEEFQKGDYM